MNLNTLVRKAATLGSLPGGSTEDHADWLIGPVGQHRDSDSIEESNFRVVIKAFQAIDPDENDHEVHRFGHFAVGWVEEIATRPGSACAALAQELRDQLDGYAILDEHDHSELESEQVSENMSEIMSELRRDLKRVYLKRHERNPESDDASEDEITDSLDEISDDDLLAVAADHATEQRDGWGYYNVEAVADKLVDKGMI